MAMGSKTEPQLGPLLPADACTKIPAAWVLLTIVSSSVPLVQPSLGGQPQLLTSTCGRRAGLGFWPARSVGAIMNWKHSVYVAGVPIPWFMLRQPTHFEPGATPISLAAPSQPEAVPTVCVPCPLSSQGAWVLGPQAPPPLWMESHQL